MNEARVQEFVHQIVNDMAASMSGVMTNIGHKLGLIKQWQAKEQLHPSS